MSWELIQETALDLEPLIDLLAEQVTEFVDGDEFDFLESGTRDMLLRIKSNIECLQEEFGYGNTTWLGDVDDELARKAVQ